MDPTTLRALAEFPRQLEAHFSAIPTAFASWEPASWEGMPSEPFSAIEQLCHVRDIEVDGYHVRLRRMRDEDHPVLASIDGEELAHTRSYATADAASVLAAIRAARTTTLDIITRLAPTQLARTAQFDGYGVLTMRSLIHYLCSHDQQHLSGLQWLMGKIAAEREVSYR